MKSKSVKVIKNDIKNSKLDKPLKSLIKKHTNETNLFYNTRLKFINSFNLTKSNLKLYEMYSNILINILFLQCRYNKKTEKIINEYINS